METSRALKKRKSHQTRKKGPLRRECVLKYKHKRLPKSRPKSGKMAKIAKKPQTKTKNVRPGWTGRRWIYMTGMTDLARKLADLQDEKKQRKEELSQLEQEIADTEETLVMQMALEEVDKFNIGDRLFYLSTRLYASPKSGRKMDLFAWLKENGHGGIVQETVNANTLSSWIKEQEELPFEVVDLLNVFEKTGVNIRKQGGRSQ